MFGGDPKLTPQALDLERQTAGATPMRRTTRWVLYAVLGVAVIGVLALFVWSFLPD